MLSYMRALVGIHLTKKKQLQIVNFHWDTILVDRILTLLTVLRNYWWNKLIILTNRDQIFFNCDCWDNHCLASRFLKEHNDNTLSPLMSLEDLRIKYNIRTKNVTKSVCSNWNIFEYCSAFWMLLNFFSQNLTSIFSLLHRSEFVVVSVQFYTARKQTCCV